jgi:hypothetical protein
METLKREKMHLSSRLDLIIYVDITKLIFSGHCTSIFQSYIGYSNSFTEDDFSKDRNIE